MKGEGQRRAHGSRREEKLPTISATRAFMGATYTILNLEVSMEPSAFLCSPICAASAGQQAVEETGNSRGLAEQGLWHRHR